LRKAREVLLLINMLCLNQADGRTLKGARIAD
jgi:hypothetical protein